MTEGHFACLGVYIRWEMTFTSQQECQGILEYDYFTVSVLLSVSLVSEPMLLADELLSSDVLSSEFSVLLSVSVELSELSELADSEVSVPVSSVVFDSSAEESLPPNRSLKNPTILSQSPSSFA